MLVPYVEGDEAKLGPIVNADYFGTVPAERLRVADGVIRFSGDGQYRSKIDLTPQRAKPVRQLRRHPPTADPRAVH